MRLRNTLSPPLKSWYNHFYAGMLCLCDKEYKMNKNKTTGLSKKPFAGRPFLLVLFLALEIFIVLYFLNDYRKHDNLYKEQLLRSFEAGYRGATNSYDQAVQMIFDEVVNKPEVLRLIALALDDDKKRDECRNELYRLMLPSYEKQKAIGILQVHFHLKDGTSFLRMHAPEKYGDNLFRRTAVYQVNKEKRPVKGYEVGYFADGYRFMYPLFYNGRHVGSIEFGITAEGIIKHLNQISPAHYAFMINRTIVDNMTYADWKKRNYRESGLSDNFMIGQEAVEDKIVASINQKLRDKVRDRLAGMGPFVEKKSADGRDYLITFLPVRDVKGDTAAYFVQYMSDEYLEHYLRITAIDITLFALLLAAIFYSIDNIQSRRKSLEQKNAELEKITRELEQRKHELNESQRIANIGSWDWDARTDIIWWSEELYRLVNMEPNQSTPKYLDHLKLYTVDSCKRLDAAVKKAMETGEPYELDLELALPDAETTWITARGEVKRNADGQIWGLRGTSQNITERKKAEEALKKSRRLLAETESVGKVGGWEFNIDTGKQTWTEEIYNIHEVALTFDPTVEKGVNFYTPASRPIIEQAVQRVIEHGEPFDVELEIITAKGNLRSVHAIGKADLEHRRVYGFFQDITGRKQAEQALRESEEIFRSFMEYSPIYVFFKDENIRSVRLSRNYEIMLGRPINELLGKSMDDLFPSDLAKSMIADDMQIMREGKTVTVEEEFNGRIYFTIKFPINIDGKLRYLAGYTIDITDRRRDEEKIKKALTEKETLLSEIHHRVKNNMQVIISLLKLQAQRIQDKDLKKPFEESEQRIRAMALVHERLYQKEDLSGINFSDYIHNIIRELKAVYRVDRRKVAVIINVEDIVLEIDSAIPCGLIINELITNCFKYAFPEGRSGEVIINFSREGSTYRLTISDNGVGLPAGFDFRQTTTLGMQIVNVLTKQLLGTLHIRSEVGTEAVIAFTKKERVDGKENNNDS